MELQKINGKERLGCDLDDVVRDTLSEVLKFSNPLFGLNLRREDIWTYDFWHIWGCSQEKSREVIMQFYRSSHFKEAKACPGAIEGLHALAPYYETNIITACSVTVADISRRHLDRYCPDVTLPLHHASSHYFLANGPGKKRTKGDVCKDLGIKIMVEDNATFAYACAQQGIETYLMKSPWNIQAPSHPLLKPVTGWDELVSRLLLRATQPLKTAPCSLVHGFAH